MPKEFKIVLRNNVTIVFPNKCIYCNGACRDEFSEIFGSNIRPFGYLKGFIEGPPKHSMPVHNLCANKMKNENKNRTVILNVVCILILGVLFMVIGRINLYIAAISVLVTGFLDKIFLEKYLKQRPISFQEDYEKTIFIFSNKKYAKEFSDLNKSTHYRERLLKDFGAKPK